MSDATVFWDIDDFAAVVAADWGTFAPNEYVVQLLGWDLCGEQS